MRKNKALSLLSLLCCLLLCFMMFPAVSAEGDVQQPGGDDPSQPGGNDPSQPGGNDPSQPGGNDPIVSKPQVTVTLQAQLEGAYIIVFAAAQDAALGGLDVALYPNGAQEPAAQAQTDAQGRAAFAAQAEWTAVQIRSEEKEEEQRVLQAAQADADMTPRLSFTLTETACSISGTVLSVQWNRPEGSDAAIVSATFNDTPVTAGGQGTGTATFDLAGLYVPAEQEWIAFDVVYTVKEGVCTVEQTRGKRLYIGTLKTKLTLTSSGNNKVTADLRDATGRAIAGAKLIFQVGANPGATGETDEYGICTFTTVAGADPKAVKCTFNETVIGTVKYLATWADLAGTTTTESTTSSATTQKPTEKPTKPTTAPTQKPTETTPSTTPPTVTEPSQQPTSVPADKTTATGARTTDLVDGRVYVGVSYDNETLKSFGLTASALTADARLLLSPAAYNAFSATGAPMLGLYASDKTLQSRTVLDASAGNKELSGYNATQFSFFVVDMQLITLDTEGAAQSVTPQEPVTVRLPVPVRMKTCRKYAIAVAGDNTLTQPVIVPVKDGCLEFAITASASYAIIGYGTEKAGSSFPFGTLFLLLGGLLVLAAAILLLYFLVIRKSRFAGDPEQEEEDNTPYVSLMDLEPEQPADPFRVQHVEKNAVTDHRDMKDFDVEL